MCIICTKHVLTIRIWAIAFLFIHATTPQPTAGGASKCTVPVIIFPLIPYMILALKYREEGRLRSG